MEIKTELSEQEQEDIFLWYTADTTEECLPIGIKRFVTNVLKHNLACGIKVIKNGTNEKN